MTDTEATMLDAERPAFCSYRPVPGQYLTATCDECGHALVLHIGVGHCPVCEMVHHNKQLRTGIASDRLEVHVTGVDERVLERVIDRMLLRGHTRGPLSWRRTP